MAFQDLSGKVLGRSYLIEDDVRLYLFRGAVYIRRCEYKRDSAQEQSYPADVLMVRVGIV